MTAQTALAAIRSQDVMLCSVYPWAFRLAAPLRVLKAEGYEAQPSRQADDMAYFAYCETKWHDLQEVDELILVYVEKPGNEYLALEIINTAKWLLSL